MTPEDTPVKKHRAGQWTITVDHSAEEGAKPATNSNAVGMVGPRTASMTVEEILAHKDSKRFQMRDDDNTPVYEGKCYLPAGYTTSAFDPLDDFGSPNYGCSSIWYRNDADTDWEEL